MRLLRPADPRLSEAVVEFSAAKLIKQVNNPDILGFSSLFMGKEYTALQASCHLSKPSNSSSCG
jgi:hypothetical protein